MEENQSYYNSLNVSSTLGSASLYFNDFLFKVIGYAISLISNIIATWQNIFRIDAIKSYNL